MPVIILISHGGMAHHLVGQMLNLANLLGRDFLEVREVEAQHLVVDIRAFLLDMCAQHLAQGGMQQVSGCVVALDSAATSHVDGGMHWCGRVGGHLLGDVHRQVVLALGVDDFNLLVTALQVALVAHLAAHLGVEWRARQHNLVVLFVLLLDLAVTQDLGVALAHVIAHKLGHALVQLHPA